MCRLWRKTSWQVRVQASCWRIAERYSPLSRLHCFPSICHQSVAINSQRQLGSFQSEPLDPGFLDDRCNESASMFRWDRRVHHDEVYPSAPASQRAQHPSGSCVGQREAGRYHRTDRAASLRKTRPRPKPACRIGHCGPDRDAMADEVTPSAFHRREQGWRRQHIAARAVIGSQPDGYRLLWSPTASAVNATLCPASVQNAARGGAAFRILTSSKAAGGRRSVESGAWHEPYTLSLPIVSARIFRFPVLIPPLSSV